MSHSLNPVFVFEYGLTPQQKSWHGHASPAERAAFFLSAPVRIAVLTALVPEQGLVQQYLPVIHGVPVGLGSLMPHDDATAALAAGQDFQDRQRRRDQGLTLDLDMLGIRGLMAEEYASPEAFDVACDAELARMVSERRENQA